MLPSRDLLDWRTHEKALELDISLVESVFRRLTMRRQATNQDDPQFIAASMTQSEIDILLFSKSDVLVALETAGQYLEKRRRLRSLHTSLASVANEREVQDITNFVRFRLKEHSISCKMAKTLLRRIYETEKARKEFEDQVLHFKQRAKDSSPWCVRNWRCIAKSPSRLYGIHNIPPKPKTAKQLEVEQRAITTLSKQLVATALGEVMARLVPQPATRPGSTGASGRRPRTRPGGEAPEDPKRSSPSSRSRFDAALKSRAKSRNDRAEQDLRLRHLRLQLFAPDISTTQTSNPGFADLLAGSADASSGEIQGLTIISERRQEIIALAEANGDVRIARSLLLHPVASSGFGRAVDQATNLSIPAENAWEVVGIWRSVYRTRTIQALQNAIAKNNCSK